jgi:two-component system sensor histidine kinase/response regulator
MPHRQTLPIVAMTASVFEDDRQRCLDAGMNEHISKPIRPEDLRSTLERCLSPKLPSAPLSR